MLQRLTQLKNRKGFTLIEMIVVLIIIAILIVATVPAMMGFIRDARERANYSEARVVYVAAQAVVTEYWGKGQIVNGDVNAAFLKTGTGSSMFNRLIGTDVTNGTLTSASASGDGNVQIEYDITDNAGATIASIKIPE